MHRASLKYYFDYLKASNYTVKYIALHNKLQTGVYTMFDPIDKIKLPKNISYVESPNFLLGKEDYATYRRKTNKYRFNNFYMFFKQQLNILPGVKSQDKLNRLKPPKDIKYPEIKKYPGTKYILEATTWVEKHFPKNHGNVDNFIYTISHKTAKQQLKDFIKHKLENFGPYQDAIDSTEIYAFHSVLSSSINIGLINPSEIIEALQGVKVKLSSMEGYIRQLFWREYQRYTYLYFDFTKKNYFGNKKKLTKRWYTGELGIPPADTLIKSGFDTGYIHHIGRLMVIGNLMNLSGISPDEGFRWFMEFACDSYLWVMHQNVYEMVFCISGGATMRKPYLSSSNYILKMSNYKRADWCAIWDDLFWQFVKKHKKLLWKFRYSMPYLAKLK